MEQVFLKIDTGIELFEISKDNVGPYFFYTYDGNIIKSYIKEEEAIEFVRSLREFLSSDHQGEEKHFCLESAFTNSYEEPNIYIKRLCKKKKVYKISMHISLYCNSACQPLFSIIFRIGDITFK